MFVNHAGNPIKRSNDSSFPMDFLKRFGPDGGHSGGYGHSVKQETRDEENVELSLGLSLNGRFGSERPRMMANDNYDTKYNMLTRASSIADFSSFSSATDDPTPLTLYPPLTRTCSLPIETEVEWKKRKELQSLRRSEAKRKRVEKLKNGRMVKGLSPEENRETKRRILINATESWPSSPPSLLPRLPRPSPFPSQVSNGSPASGGSSGVSDLENQLSSGTNKDTELKSTASQQSAASHNKMSRSNSIASEDKSKVVINGDHAKDETLKMILADMPCVTTKGEGVDGKKIEGFLYRYRKGEDVRIVCVCHGSFFTPAEFVKHGGGGDVQHPLRHIVVNPPTL